MDATQAAPTPIITNAGYDAALAARPAVGRSWLYRPESAWTYAHHASLTWFAGRYLAMWSNGRDDEDAPGQRVLWAASPDGRVWSDPIPLLDTQATADGELVLTAAGFHRHADQLVAYIGSYAYRPEFLRDGRRQPGDHGHAGTTLLAMTSRDGFAWNPPVDLRLPVVPNHGPQRLASGRLLISGNVSFPRTDDPSGLTGWRMGGIYPPAMAESIIDDSESFWRVRDAMGWPVGLCEGSFLQTDDGVVRMLLRSNSERLWQSESRDDAATWSAPVRTGFSDNASKFHFGRLPDGRFYYVGTPDTEPRWQRSPLVLSLSPDGVRFDRHYILADDTTPYRQRAEGMHKGGDYGYPHTLVHDGAIHVIVSRRKEAIEVLRVPLTALA